ELLGLHRGQVGVPHPSGFVVVLALLLAQRGEVLSGEALERVAAGGVDELVPPLFAGEDEAVGVVRREPAPPLVAHSSNTSKPPSGCFWNESRSPDCGFG